MAQVWLPQCGVVEDDNLPLLDRLLAVAKGELSPSELTLWVVQNLPPEYIQAVSELLKLCYPHLGGTA